MSYISVSSGGPLPDSKTDMHRCFTCHMHFQSEPWWAMKIRLQTMALYSSGIMYCTVESLPSSSNVHMPL